MRKTGKGFGRNRTRKAKRPKCRLLLSGDLGIFGPSGQALINFFELIIGHKMPQEAAQISRIFKRLKKLKESLGERSRYTATAISFLTSCQKCIRDTTVKTRLDERQRKIMEAIGFFNKALGGNHIVRVAL